MLLGKKHLLILCSVVVMFFIALPNAAVHTSSLSEEIERQSDSFSGSEGASFTVDTDPRLLVAGIVQIVVSLLGTIFLVYGFWGGYQIFISNGNEEQIRKGKSTILTAAIGMLLMLMSYSVTRFITRSLESSIIRNELQDQRIQNDQNFNINPDPLAP
jgi:hypothetical protein